MGKNEVNGKKELILKAAGDIFFEKGYHSATVEEIAKRAEIGKGTIYQYFPSKHDILLEMLQIKFGKYTDGIEESVQQEDSVENNMRRVIQNHFTELENIYRFANNLFHMGNDSAHCGTPASTLMTDYKNRITGAFVKMIQVGQSRGELREGDPTLIAAAIIGTLVGISGWLIEHHGFQDDDTKKDSFVDSVTQIVLAGLKTN